MNAPIECPNCGRLYRADKLATCPGCSANSVETFKISQPSQPRNSYSKSQEITEEADLERLIAAQNRTTHAVRAFVRLLLYSVSGLSAGGFFWYLSLFTIDIDSCQEYGDNCNGNLFLQFFAVSLCIGTFLYGVKAAWSDFIKSDL